ncbi:hypothetical protein FraEuI1c_2308 [Pseudofrankia inefficax]|uniref:Uncharacterized protein n=1 Tax=Pseudofrankia inefficax (strain DSM 45817 / CECT 9037 / DDB 130130 / EuI1c) TaxID=298654 RepID=E3J064_PSEI1|nr:hypothetical protein FraEuI1c_2308 [Pseudofrankia inefficax]
MARWAPLIIRRRTESDAGFPVSRLGGDDRRMATYVILLVVVLFLALGLLGLLYYVLNRAEHERHR